MARRRRPSRRVANVAYRREEWGLAYETFLENHPQYVQGSNASYTAFEAALETRRTRTQASRYRSNYNRNLRVLNRRQQAQAALGNPQMVPAPNPNNLTAAAQALQWLRDNRESVLNGTAVYVMRIGDVYYTVNATTYRRMFNLALNEDTGDDEEAFESNPKVLYEFRNSGVFFTPVLFTAEDTPQRRMNPDRHEGNFAPYTHTFEDPFMIDLLASLGVFTEVKAENYETNCLVHSLKDKVSPAAMNELKQCVRNATVPRKHLTKIGKEFNIKFIIHSHGDSDVRTYGAVEDDATVAELCLYDNHYFPYIHDTGVTGFAIKNYHQLQDRYPNSWKKKQNFKGTSSAKGISSMRLMIVLYQSEHVKPIDLSNEEIYRTVYIKKAARTFSNLAFSDQTIQLVHEPRNRSEDLEEHRQEIVNLKRYKRQIAQCPSGDDTLKRLEAQASELGMGFKEQVDLFRSNLLSDAIIFFDFESSSEGCHTAYLVAWQVDGEDEVFHRSGESCALEFLQWINDYYGADNNDDVSITLIAHNVSYDISFLLEHLEPGSMKAIKKGSKFISASGKFFEVTLHFKDSWKIIPAPLRDFPKMFNLSFEKEIMPYEVFTQSFIQTDFFIHPSIIEAAYNNPYVESMRPNIIKWGCERSDGQWDMLTYSRMYCEGDVKLMSEGWNRYREMSLDHFNIDINGREVMTVAGMAYRHLKNECFTNSYSISGPILAFIREATIGGQTQSARNESMVVDGPILDEDKRSLYPSAMVNMPGVMKGKPKVFIGEIPSNADYFYVQIKVLKREGPDYDFPILAVRNTEGVNVWTNDIVDRTIIIGKRTLMDLTYWNTTFEYEVIHGYYWDEGWNTSLTTTMRKMYDLRVELKQVGNPAQLVAKLLMNAAYGRTGLKPVAEDDKYLSSDKLNRFIANNHNHIAKMMLMPNGDTRVLVNKPINRHFNQQQIAAMILEYSKHDMRKVLCLQQLLGSPFSHQIYYTDTDSIHISKASWNNLNELYTSHFGTVLEGKELGQFHSDFELNGTCQRIPIEDDKYKIVPTTMSATELMGGQLFSRKLFICGKKAYLDVLTSTANPSLEVYHFRLKGIPESSLLEVCNAEYNGDILHLYQELVNGKPIKFTLRGLFKCSFTGVFETISQERQVQFKPKVPTQ